MSLRIFHDHEFTESEKAYLRSWNRHDEIEENARRVREGRLETAVVEQHSPNQSENVIELDDDIFDFVNSLSGERLSAGLKKYKLEPQQNEQDAKAVLAQFLQDARDSGRNVKLPTTKQDSDE